MTEQQFLGLSDNYGKKELKDAFLKKVSELDFEIDIEAIFNCIQSYQRLHQQTEVSTQDSLFTIPYSEEETDSGYEDLYDSPEKLIARFTDLYENTATRFNKSLWKSAMEHPVNYDSENLAAYCQPVADFLSKHPFLKSNILRLIAETFPFNKFFPDPKEAQNEDFWKAYGYAYNLLQKGNTEFDLYADLLNTGQYTSDQLDDMFHRISYSSAYYRREQYAQAFNVLSEGIPANGKPLLIWQRELNILYKAAVVAKTEGLDGHFINTLNNALAAFPHDEHLLYMRVRFLFHRYEPQKFKEEIIATLKRIPEHPQCLFLLGKCYMQLGIARAALIIFENLKKLYPLHMEYVTAAALASRRYIDFCIREHDPKDNSTQYYIHMIGNLIELNLFDEVAAFAADAPKEDADIAALLLYSKCAETSFFHGQKDKGLLMEALKIAGDREIIRKIKALYLKDLPDWSDIKAEKEFIREYYQAYPQDAMANYHMGMSYYAEADYEEAFQYMLKAKSINPSDTEIYYNLARAAAMTRRYTEAVEHINVYLLYNKYHLGANELHCDWLYTLKEYGKAHTSAKWILSLCNTPDFRPKYFFYFTTALAMHLNSIEPEKHNQNYIADMLDLYDRYPKPATFWSDDYGSKSMYWAASICSRAGKHEKCVEYLQCILKNVKEYKWPLMEECLFELLPESLHALYWHEELIKSLEEPTRALLAQKHYNPAASIPSYYIARAYDGMGMLDKKMEWVQNCAYCYMQSENPPIDWIENLLIENFDLCLEYNIPSGAIVIGASYIEIINPPNVNCSWVAYQMGNICSAKGEEKEAIEYYQACISFGQLFPDSNQEEVKAAQQLLNSLNAPESSN